MREYEELEPVKKRKEKEMKYGVGIDVSKGKSMIAITSTEGEIVQMPFEVRHNKEGMAKLETVLRQQEKDDIKIVMEATGIYHMPIYCYLIEQGYEVIIENAYLMKKYMDRGIRKGKTDKIDAIKLSEYCSENWYKLKKAKETEEKYEELKMLSRAYINQIEMQAEAKVNFSNLCDRSFPGYYQLMSDANIEIGIKIYEKYNHPKKVLEKSEKEFMEEVEKIAQKIGHRTAGISLAKKIYNLAKVTISPSPNTESLSLIAKVTTEVLTTHLKTSKEIISKMEEIAKGLVEYKIVREMPGCGRKLSVMLIAEIGDIRKYNGASSLIASAGIDAPPYQSGQYKAQIVHITKRGNKYLRKIGYEIMMGIVSVVKDGNEIKEYIKKKETEGKPKKVAKIAGLNKFLRQYYAKVRDEYIKVGMWA